MVKLENKSHNTYMPSPLYTHLAIAHLAPKVAGLSPYI